MTSKVTMKLETQVTSLEPSQKLEKLGVKQESIWYWKVKNGKAELILDTNLTTLEWDIVMRRRENINAYKDYSYYSAYTVAELSEILPKELGGDYGGVLLMSWVNGKEWETDYYSFYNNSGASQLGKMPHMYTLDKSLPDSMSKMLIYLIENKLINNPK